MTRGLILCGVVGMASMVAAEAARDYPIRPAPFTAVHVDSKFWSPRLETNRRVTVWYDFHKCEETGRIANFARAGKLEPGKFQGTPYDDSDVYKVIEGAAYSLALQPDPKLDAYLDGLIAKIAAAQEPDGYLYTARTLGLNDDFTGPTRWSNLKQSHELYNVGHLYEAAVAHWQATGKRSLLDVARRNADLICRTFGPGREQRVEAPGHQEIEIGLVKLARATGDEKYLRQARFFLDVRGRADRRRLFGEYAQDHVPIVEQREAVGHAVRAGYMYAGIADVAALTGDDVYRRAIDRLWEDVVFRKMHVTGGIGATRAGEAFGRAYDLPNRTAYLETCAAIAHALFNHRMFLMHGDAKYLDVLERTLYNGFLVGVGFSGDRFFYPNPLACDGRTKFNQGTLGRAPWFNCACCPVNVVRFLPSMPGFVYAATDDSLFVNLYVAGAASVKTAGQTVRVEQRTEYPWEGRVALRIQPEQPAEFALRLRIPGWVVGRPAPGDLYRYADATPANWSLTLNGKPHEPELRDGFATIRRTWTAGDAIELTLPMPVRRVFSHDSVAENRGRVALERGPLVYCIEAVDNDGSVEDRVLSDRAGLRTEHRPDLLGGVVVVRATAAQVRFDARGAATTQPVELTAIPYFAWAHRQIGEMAVWLPRTPALVRPPPAPTLASRSTPSASHVHAGDTLEALHDQIEPGGSADHDLPRFTWWDRRGSREWVQYDLPGATKVSAVDVYWFDDTGRGQCRVPKSWRLLYRAGGAWTPVKTGAAFSVEKDRYNVVAFDSIMTDGLRIEVELQPGYSGGMLEWRVR